MLALLPYLTRVYAPESFATLAQVTVLGLLFSIIMTGRLEVALVLPKLENISRTVNSVVVFLIIAVAIFSVIFSVIIFENKFRYLVLLSIVVGVSLSFINLSINNYIRNSDFAKISKLKISQSLLIIFFQVIIVNIGYDFGLVYGYVLGLVVTALSFTDFKFFARKLTLRKFMFVVRKYKQFPLFNASQSVLNSASSNVLIFTIGATFGQAILGQYSLANRAIQTPMSIVSSAIKQVAYKDIADRFNRNKPVYSVLLKQTFMSAIIPIVPFYIYIYYSETLIPYVFGQDWAEVASISNYLVIWFYFIFISVPATSAVQVYNMQGSYFVYESVLVLVRMLFIGFAYTSGLYFYDFVLGFALIGASFNAFLTIFVLVKIKGKDFKK